MALPEATVAVQLQLQSKTRYLLLSTHPEFCRVELLEKPEKSWRKSGHLFTSIRGGQLRDISQLGFDRALEFAVERRVEVGAVRKYRLLLELTGPQANLLLVESETGKISQCLRIVKAGKKQSREIAPGRLYSPLPKRDKLSPLELNFAKLSALRAREPRRSFKRLFTSQIWGVNDSIIEEVAARSGIGAQVKVGELSEKDLLAVSRTIEQLYSASPSEKRKASVIVDQTGKPTELLFYSRRGAPGESTKIFSSSLEAASFFYQSFIKTRELQRRWAVLARKVNSLVAKTERRKQLLQQKLSESRKKELYKIWGDLLMLVPDKKKRGRKGISVDNIFREPAEAVTIELDPKRSILENARRYYRKFRKAASGEKKVEAQLQKINSELEILERARESLACQPAEPLVLNLRRELAPLGITDTTRQAQKSSVKGKAGAKFRPREFVTTDGWRVLVGRSDVENDHLTFRLASKEDIWFHARGAHGSHAILRRPSRKSEPSKKSIAEAASVAAYFSKQRTSSKVSVSYTLVKHLRKPRKAKPGLVLVQQEESVLVEPRLLRVAEPSETVDDQVERSRGRSLESRL